MPAHTGRLLLTHQDPFHVPELCSLLAGLRASGFVGQPLAMESLAYEAGPSFLQLVSFAGCSVQLNLSAKGDKPFCYVCLTGPYPAPRLLSGRNTRPPRCRQCRARIMEWGEMRDRQDATRARTTHCAACGHLVPIRDLDWKQSAGFGRLFVQVEEVFPGEATPTPELMVLLARLTGGDWRYFYVQDA
jgi:hypothetical protein